MRMQYVDETVVVNKPIPMKASNLGAVILLSVLVSAIIFHFFLDNYPK